LYYYHIYQYNIFKTMHRVEISDEGEYFRLIIHNISMIVDKNINSTYLSYGIPYHEIVINNDVIKIYNSNIYCEMTTERFYIKCSRGEEIFIKMYPNQFNGIKDMFSKKVSTTQEVKILPNTDIDIEPIDACEEITRLYGDNVACMFPSKLAHKLSEKYKSFEKREIYYQDFISLCMENQETYEKQIKLIILDKEDEIKKRDIFNSEVVEYMIKHKKKYLKYVKHLKVEYILKYVDLTHMSYDDISTNYKIAFIAKRVIRHGDYGHEYRNEAFKYNNKIIDSQKDIEIRKEWLRMDYTAIQHYDSTLDEQLLVINNDINAFSFIKNPHPKAIEQYYNNLLNRYIDKIL